jgi:hypothetical protein
MDFNFDTGTIFDGIQTIDTTIAPPLGTQTNILFIIGNGALALPRGTTGQQPSPAVGGMLRYNNLGYLEFYDDLIPSWVQLSSGGGTVTSITVTTDSPALEVNGGSTATITSTGTFALTLSSTLDSLGNLASNGIIVNNAGTITGVTIVGTAGNITVANGNGVGGNPTIDLATVTPGASGSFDKFTTDAYGRVVDYTPVTQADIVSALGTYYLPLSGGTMTGAINMGGFQINDLGMSGTPAGTDAVNVNYVQSQLQGLSWKEAVAAATTADLGSVTYNNGAAGVGATLTNAGTQVPLVIDGYTVAPGDRILVKNQANQTQNGIYVVTATGSVSSNWVLTRSTDTDTGQQLFGAAVYVDEGTVNENTGWTQTTPGPLTIGTSNITWAQFTGSGTYTAGTGLTLTGNTFSLSTPVSIANGGTGASTPSTAFNNLSPLTTAGDTLYYNGTTNARLPIGTTGQVLTVVGGEPAWGTNAITLNADSGSGSVALGGTLTIDGTTNYITTTVSGSTYTLDISATYPGQTSITTLGTITTGVWNGTPIGFAYGGTGVSATPSNGQLLIGNGTGYTLSTITPGTAISVVNGPGTITINNTGVTSAVAGTGISVSSATGAVTFSNTGVLSFATSLQGLTPSSPTTGAVVLAGILGPMSGGTGINNGAYTITLGGNISTGGSFTTTPGNNITFTTTGPTNVTLPTSGTLLTSSTAVTTFDLNDTSTTPIYTTFPTTPTSGAIASTITLNTQDANYVFAGPVSGSAAQPTFRALTAADVAFALQLYRENPVTPITPVATGTNAVAIGSGANASQLGAFAYAGGDFATSGDAQAGLYVLRTITTSATPGELFLDGAAQEFIVPNNSVVTFSIMVAARRTDATGGGAGYKFEGVVRKDTTAASVTFVGVPSKTVFGETDTPWDTTLTVNTGTGGLKLTGTGQAAKTIRWVATMRTTEVTN